MAQYTIDKDIPLPPPRGQRFPCLNRYPFAQLGIGHSFFVPDCSSEHCRNDCVKAGKALNAKFISRVEGDGVRIWRIK